ncbi:hypothetical protein HOG75_05835 [bacterium]|jgi:hypothetical protein|nr:hypothetical protein [bacterium]MBT5989208.1 hypothetical protein [bacterium]
MLDINPKTRISAQDALSHPGLQSSESIPIEVAPPNTPFSAQDQEMQSLISRISTI